MAGEPGIGESEVKIDKIENTLHKFEVTSEFFNPVVEVDQSGFKRRVYKYGDVTFSFRGREEMPIIPTINSSRTELLGSEPIHADKSSFEEYKRSLETQNETAEKTCLLVSKDIQGVIELAIKLGAKDEWLAKTLDEVKGRIYGVKALDLMDQLIVCNWVKEDGSVWEDSYGGSKAEALVVASLLGDTGSRDYINVQLDKMLDLDKKREQEFREKWKEAWDYSEEHFDPPNIDELAAVHATKYLPKSYPNGYEIPTTADATGYEHVRNTIHITLNHKVRSHLGGNWEMTPYTIVGRFDQMLKENGKPRGIDLYDTWWVRNPGEALKFPGASLVEPGTPPSELLFVFKERNTIFKGGSYTLEDLDKVEKEREWSGCWEGFQSVLIPYEYEQIQTDWDFKRLSEVFISKYFSKPDEAEIAPDRGRSGPQHQSFSVLFKNSEGKMLVRDRVLQLLRDANLNESFRKDPSGLEEARQLLANKITSNIESRLFSEINEMAVDATIKQLGCPLSKDLHGQTGSLGRRFLAVSGPAEHSHSVYHFFEQGLGNYVKDAMVKEKDGKEHFDWTLFDPKWPSLPDLDAKTKRVLYASGAFNSREDQL
ncbi:MAG: hypothetical protein ABIJ85_02735 [bacterium]